MGKIKFCEEQHTSRKRLLLVVPLVLAIQLIIIAYWFIRVNYSGESIESVLHSQPVINLLVIGLIVLVVTTLVVVLNAIARIKTKISDKGIFISYPPFRPKPHQIKPNEIARYKIRRFKPFREFKGYGVKDTRRYGKAYIISGNVGLQLYLKSGKRLLIGTQNRQAIKYAMDKLMNKKNQEGEK